jgi:hypothetical protein
MAREIHEREDLLRDAVALVPRVLIQVALNGRRCEVFAGFRGDSLSLYFGGDPVYHFNADGELRRAYLADQLVKAEQGQLVTLNRQRAVKEVLLERQTADPAAAQAIVDQMHCRLAELRSAMAAQQFECVGEAPTKGEALPRLVAWLDDHPEAKIAASPRVT